MRREFKGAANKAQLITSLGGSTADLTINCGALTGWPTGVGSTPFYIVIDRDLASEEKILCSSRSGNVLTVLNSGLTNGRGQDDTNITSHTANAYVEHIFTATDADEANAHVNTPPLHITVCTSLTRPAAPVTNQTILETDTLSMYSYIGSAWQQVSSTTSGGDFSPLLLIGA
jgi:hypothetical protein